jgi:hypothetical protein
MTDIASELAASFIASQGWTCILVKPATEEVVVTIGEISARNESGQRVWLRRRRKADRVIASFL